MPIILTGKNNPTDIYYGDHPLRMVLLGDTIVWQKTSAPPPPGTPVTLTSADLTSDGILVAQGIGFPTISLKYPMYFFQGKPPVGYTYKEKLTFIGSEAHMVYLESIESYDHYKLAAEPSDEILDYPMFHFDGYPQNFVFDEKLTFLGEDVIRWEVKSIDELLWGKSNEYGTVYFPMQFFNQGWPQEGTYRFPWYLTFINKELDPDDPPPQTIFVVEPVFAELWLDEYVDIVCYTNTPNRHIGLHNLVNGRLIIDQFDKYNILFDTNLGDYELNYVTIRFTNANTYEGETSFWVTLMNVVNMTLISINVIIITHLTARPPREPGLFDVSPDSNIANESNQFSIMYQYNYTDAT